MFSNSELSLFQSDYFSHFKYEKNYRGSIPKHRSLVENLPYGHAEIRHGCCLASVPRCEKVP